MHTFVFLWLLTGICTCCFPPYQVPASLYTVDHTVSWGGSPICTGLFHILYISSKKNLLKWLSLVLSSSSDFPATKTLSCPELSHMCNDAYNCCFLFLNPCSTDMYFVSIITLALHPSFELLHLCKEVKELPFSHIKQSKNDKQAHKQNPATPSP